MEGFLGLSRIRRYVIIYSIVIFILVTLSVAFFILYPLSNRIVKFETSRLVSLIRDKKAAIEGYLSTYKGISYRIFSQSEIVTLYRDYSKGKISLEDIRRSVLSPFQYVLSTFLDIKGISLLLKNKSHILDVGDTFNGRIIKDKDINSGGISDPFKVKEKWYIKIMVPIKDNDEVLGWGIVVVDITRVMNFVKERLVGIHYVDFLVGDIKDGKPRAFIHKGKKRVLSLLEKEMERVKKIKDVEVIRTLGAGNTSHTMVCVPIKDTDWIFILGIDERVLLTPIVSTVRLLLLFIALVIGIGTFFLYILFIRIVKEKILQAKKLEAEISTKSLQLAEEIQKRENLEDLYTVNMNFLAVVLDTMPLPIVARDVEKGDYIFANRAFVNIINLDINDIIGKTPYDIWDRKTVETIDRLDREVAKSREEIILEFEFTTIFGKKLYGILTKAPFFNKDGEVMGVVSAFLDLTEKKKLEMELSRLASVVEQAYEYIMITDTDGKIVYVNPAFTTVTGYKKKEVIGKTPKILKSGKHSEEFYKEFWETIKGGRVWKGEFINKRKNGEEYYDYTVAFPIKDKEGNIINFAAIKRDITEEKIKERRLQQVQKMDIIGRLVGGIAHDFNNLLTVIIGYSDFIINKVSEKDPIYTYAKKINDTGERAKELTSKLLAFGRRQIYNPQVIDINERIHEIWSLILRRVVPESIEIELNLSPKPLYIYADPVQIEQIIMNLVINARDALLEKEKVTKKSYKKMVTIETDSVFLDESYVKFHPGSRVGEFVVISVSDNGIGMDEETVEKVFEPFFTTKEEGKGTGLGLSTIYGIVKQNNATIYVYSEPLEGTTFKIYWPISKVKKEVKQGKTGKIKDILKGDEVLLVVEDNDEVREFMKDSLTLLEYKVYEAKDGKEALDLITRQKIVPDLLVTDVVMPEINGEELAKRVKEIVPHIKVLFTSGYTYNHIVKNGALKKGIKFIHKPFSVIDLARKIREILDESP